MSLQIKLQHEIQQAFSSLYEATPELEKIQLQETRKDFEGTHTFVTFPFGKLTKEAPHVSAENIGKYLVENTAVVEKFNVVKGFLNLSISPAFWLESFRAQAAQESLAQAETTGKQIMVEYSSPNTNKPLHLGHLRNNFLGFSVSNILTAAGNNVMKVNLVNDRGIHICKSMLMYARYGEGKTPADFGKKGDQVIGDFYVRFDKENKAQAAELFEKLKAENPNEREEALKTKAANHTPLMQEAREMLVKWEHKDPEVYALWEKLNGWVYEGHNETYKNTGVSFDKFYYESETYLLGKSIVEEGLEKGLFFKKEDNSVWVDLSEDGLDEKLLLRGDGTSVYMTQDMGTADLKYEDFKMSKSVYVVGNEQDYHFKVLQLILQKLGRPYADGIFHLSYGMVELPEGKMKTREGTVVDADQLVADMVALAKEKTAELGKIADLSEEEAETLYRQLALGALKYYLLRVEPRKKMLFNPQESIDFSGNSGVYLQYTHARISSILRKAKAEKGIDSATLFESDFSVNLEETEIELLGLLQQFPEKVQEAYKGFAPSVIANYLYDLAKTYAKFYNDCPVLSSEGDQLRFRVALCGQAARALREAGELLGIEMPERM